MTKPHIHNFLVPILIMLFLLAGKSSLAAAISPLDALQAPIEKVLELLNDPKFKDPVHRQHQRNKIFEITNKIFDFTEMSKRALARNWKSFSPQEQKQFVDVFSEHLNNTYMDKVQGEYKGETVMFLNQEMVSEGKATVTTKVQREPNAISVDYSMLMVDNHWRVYDVNVEGVSLIKNYRTQFDQILSKETPAQLIERLKKKNDIKIEN